MSQDRVGVLEVALEHTVAIGLRGYRLTVRLGSLALGLSSLVLRITCLIVGHGDGRAQEESGSPARVLMVEGQVGQVADIKVGCAEERGQVLV